MNTTTVRKPVDPREATFAVRVGDPLVVDVDQHGSGWTIIDVHTRTYDLYRDGRDLTVPHDAVYLT